ncbi:helix-turn-helix transcriptional regulator [Sedimenticola selenatireducens]|jgi:XRE family aerobic/anaerobic benzoate catabolism transcriptional regulator|uniref:Shikimate kinase n=1 Tax=Sedimenticola selenatireducens TaxID=191960 RepID=A0A558DXM8_9GAMM|nr:helix-turn-helix transcriptional regulator [Sedimenticola selenatireducens]TVO70965.1 helix-turn-helix domain-containing protein [Sedimenticola selenatireducens]TVT65831.1 MAG: helix-turn-helix domain-containing protein [Sedimenticola selenatireducens]
MTETTNATTGSEIAIEQLTEEVGSRVRSVRSRRGLTRKNLAFHSDVSERYLAQLERGTANVSLALLSRIAKALGVRIGSLLPEQEESCIKYPPLGELVDTFSLETQEKAYQLLRGAFSQGQGAYRGVALIGLRGGGKSTLGELLAKHYQVPFIRMQNVISQLAGMDMGELISLTGQANYRRLELQALQQTITDYRHVVIETGGSLISESETYRVLREHFFTVWVRALPEDHMNRVIEQGDMRPMAGNQQAMDDLKLILTERETDYRLADYQIMTSGQTIDQSLNTLIKQCGPYLQGS